MEKKILNLISGIIIFLLIFIISGEILTRIKGVKPSAIWYVGVEPHTFFQIDSLLGWKQGTGKFTITVLDTSNKFTATINKFGERISSENDTFSVLSTKPTIHMYGCSFIFGFSIADSATSSYKLQSLLPNYKVINKGVPGYGITQMYLSLKKSLIEGDTPVIAVFNYAYFHDDRTPLCREWNSRFGYVISQGYSHKFKNINYPYMLYKDKKLKLYFESFNNPIKDWPFRTKSSFVNLLNTFYNLYVDEKGVKYRHLVAQKTALEIVRYCRANHIIPIFTNVTPEIENILFFQNIKDVGCYTINFNVPVMNDKDSTSIYNCGPSDPGHPSSFSHTIYAKKVYKLIADSILIKK